LLVAQILVSSRTPKAIRDPGDWGQQPAQSPGSRLSAALRPGWHLL